MTKRSSLPLAPTVCLVLVVMCALGAPLLAPYDAATVHVRDALEPPSWLHSGSLRYTMGTDHLGRDVFSRLIYGARPSILVALCAVALSGTLGTLLGLAAGYYGSNVDTLIMRLVDIWLSMPTILIAIALVAIIGAKLESVVFAYVMLNWVYYTRVIRAQTLVVKEAEFIHAAIAIGSRSGRILGRHILPNVIGSMIVLATLDVGRAIIFESSLSFLGLGLQPPNSSWGLMLAEARQYLSISWWLPAFPGLAITATVLSANIVGDWLRDRYDPRRGMKIV